MRLIYGLFGVLLFVFVLGFAIKNAEPVIVHYYLGIAWQLPLSLLVLITLFVGVAIGLIASLFPYVKQRRALLALQRELQTLKPNE